MYIQTNNNKVTSRLHQGLKEKVPGKLGRFRKRDTFVVPKYIIVS